MNRVFHMVILICVVLLAGCDGAQSMFQPMASDAERIVLLFYIMLVGFSAVFAFVACCVWLACRGSDASRRILGTETVVFRLGLLFPVTVLTVLLIWGFRLLADAVRDGGQPDLVVRVQGEQWWWRVTYVRPDGSEVESANELRLPVGAEVLLELSSADVLHSFWIPAWAGKVDMIPGHTNFLRLKLARTGTVRGQCAEYCGGAHALMGLYGVAMEADAFAQWLAHEAGPAVPDARSSPGRATFIGSGCGACHRVRGDDAPGRTGPDLTHLGGRLSVGAGLLSNDTAGLELWLARHPVLKPENHMPAFAFLSAAEREALALYLESLQ